MIVEGERRQALAALAEIGVCPRPLAALERCGRRSLGAGVDSEAPSLCVRLGDGLTVNLAALVAAADCGT